MPYVNFAPLRRLSPAAFKLYVYFLDQVQIRNTSTFSSSLADLAHESGLQRFYMYPAWRHGKDGQLRNALSELIDAGWIEKQGRRGRTPNTYTVRHPHLHENTEDERRPT